jgi:rhamnosyltransferase
MRASIIIRTFNEERYLPMLLESVDKQSVPSNEREIIVVDSGSTDATKRIAESAKARLIDIARDDFSFGRSLNFGCEHANGRSLVFISGHCVPASPVWLEKLLGPIEAGEAVLAYGRQRGGPSTNFSEEQIFRKYFPQSYAARQNGFFCNNANAAIKRSAWAENRFDETLTGLEDLDLAKRLVGGNHKIEYVPDAEVFHYHHEGAGQVIRRFEREALALQSIMPEIQIGLGTTARYILTAIASDWRKALQEGRFAQSFLEIPKYRFCQYYGTWKGNHNHRKMSREARERFFYPQ